MMPRKALTPNEMWAALVAVAGHVPVPLTSHDYLELLPVRWQAITPAGITIHHRTYDADSLAQYRGQASPVAGRGGKWEIHRLTRPLAEDVRRPWESPMEPNRLTPARVRRGFRNLRPALPCPARAPKPTRPGPGRPLGSKNQRPATRYDVGKTVRRPESIIERDQARP